MFFFICFILLVITLLAHSLPLALHERSAQP
jgi:hypothetical protein